MITYDVKINKNGDEMTGDFSFKGLSTDTKPTVSHNGIQIKNGSSFLEIDTQDTNYYDGKTNAWV